MDNISLSPTGRFEIEVSPWEARMSLWIEPPTISDKSTDEILLAFNDKHWSLDEADWVSDSVVELWLRKYPGNHLPTGLLATLDCLAKTAKVADKTVPLKKLENALELSLTWPQPVVPETPRGLVATLRRLFKMNRS